MEHSGPAPSSSQEKPKFFSFDPEFLAVAALAPADTDGSINLVNAVAKIRQHSQDYRSINQLPNRSGPVLQSAPLNIPDPSGTASSAYKPSHFASVQQPACIQFHTFARPIHQLPNRPVLQSVPPGTSGIAPQNGPLGDQTHLSNVQLMQHYKGDIAANSQHVPQSMIVRQPGPSLETQQESATTPL